MAQFANVNRAKQHNILKNANTTLLGNLLTAASDWIEGYCRRVFTETEHTDEAHDGDGTTGLFLDNFPVSDVASVTIIDSDGTETDIDNTDDDVFRIADDEGYIEFAPSASEDYGHFPGGFRNVKVTYTAGFATIPEPVVQASIYVAIQLYSQGADMTNPGMKSWKMGEASFTRKSGADLVILTPMIKWLLAKFRKNGG